MSAQILPFRPRGSAEPVPEQTPENTVPHLELSHVDFTTVQQLEKALEMAKEGKLHGLALISWDPSVNGFMRWSTTPEDEDQSSAALRFLGALTLLNRDFEFIAHQSYAPMTAEDSP